MVTWKEFAAAAPELAQAGRSLLNQFRVGLAFLATVRADGGSRLHPVCPVLAGFSFSSRPHRRSGMTCSGMGGTRFRRFPSRSPEATSSTSRAEPSGERSGDNCGPAHHRCRWGDLLRDVKHMADESETAFELWIDRVMHTTWENVLTPQMRS